MAGKDTDKIVSGYGLSRSWFDFAFENQDIINPTHTAMFLWLLELNNRMGWCAKFASPASQTMAAIGLKSYNTYKKVFDELVGFGFVKVITESKNQYTACIIALSNNDNACNKALDKALDKALTKHTTKQSGSTQQSTVQSIDSINKPLNKETKKQRNISRSIEQFQEIARTTFKNVQCDFGTEFKKLWFDLIQTDHWKKKSQSAYDYNLKRLMKFDEEFCQSLVECAIAGEYKGVVFPNTAADYKKYLKLKDGITKTTGTTADAIESRRSLVAAAAAVLGSYQA